ncbi:MAG: ribulose-phosphate 3-epimerase [Fidelibacterota bacterium]
MNKPRIISPSLLSADFSKLENEIRTVETAGASRLHLDIMDGHFVPNITFGPLIVKAIRQMSDCILDCHLMIQNPEKYIDQFISAGADTVILHVESQLELIHDFKRIRTAGRSVGVSINPDTPIEKTIPFLDIVDQVLIMSVHPGFGGQEFIRNALVKIEYLAKCRKNRNYIISVDGGVNKQTISDVFKAGADMAVVGSGLFSASDRTHRFQELLNA